MTFHPLSDFFGYRSNFYYVFLSFIILSLEIKRKENFYDAPNNFRDFNIINFITNQITCDILILLLAKSDSHIHI